MQPHAIAINIVSFRIKGRNEILIFVVMSSSSENTNGNAPLGVVEGVARLESELKAYFLRNGEVLEKSRVPVVNARSPQDTTP